MSSLCIIVFHKVLHHCIIISIQLHVINISLHTNFLYTQVYRYLQVYLCRSPQVTGQGILLTGTCHADPGIPGSGLVKNLMRCSHCPTSGIQRRIDRQIVCVHYSHRRKRNGEQDRSMKLTQTWLFWRWLSSLLWQQEIKCDFEPLEPFPCTRTARRREKMVWEWGQ